MNSRYYIQFTVIPRRRDLVRLGIDMTRRYFRGNIKSRGMCNNSEQLLQACTLVESLFKYL